MSQVDNECLYNNWVHSYEEDEPGKKVYRPSIFRFPLSFGRESIHIKENGEVLFSHPGKDDRMISRIGQFQIRDSDKIDVNLDGNHFTITVLSCEPDRLVIIK
jgi:hypothetical protein